MPFPGIVSTRPRQSHNRAVPQQVDQRQPNFVHGWQATLPADGEWYNLTEPTMGYFTAPIVPGVFRDRSVRCIEVVNLSEDDTIEISGAAAADTTLPGYPTTGASIPPGGFKEYDIALLSAISLRNPGENPVVVSLQFSAEEK